MARINTYSTDTTVQKNDKLLGSNADGTTRNFSIEDISTFQANTNSAAVIGQLPYVYHNNSFGGNSSRQAGSITINTTATTTAFSSVTTLKVSKTPNGYTSDVVAVLTAFLDKDIIISSNDDPNNFATYKCTAVTQDSSETDFYDLSLTYITGNGNLEVGEFYSTSRDISTSENTTYDISIPSGTTSLRLTGSDASTDDIVISGSGGVTVSRTSANILDISSAAEQYTGTVTSVSGTGTVSGLTLSGTVTSSGSLTLGGTLTLTSSDITTGLGYTPYNATNPDGYTTNTGTVTGTGTTNYLSKFTSSSAIGDSLVFDNGTNVGIGTASPSYKLHVSGTVKGSDFFGNLFSVGNEGKVVSTSSLGLQLQATAGSKPITFFTNVGGNTERMRIAYDGNVGIGTTSPAAKLHLSESASGGNPSFILQDNARSGAATLNYILLTDSSNTNQAKIGYLSGLNTDLTLQNLVGNTSLISSNQIKITAGTNTLFENSGSEKMRITSTGNVGIGTTSPSDKLHIEGDSTPTIKIVDTTNTTITELYSNNFDTYLANESSGRVLIRTGGSNGFVVNSSGNVGIGTTIPSQKLDVVGNARITGAIYDSNNEPGTSGQVLSSTATGTDWVSLSEIQGVDGTGTANYVTKWSDSDTVTDSVIFDNGTNVGVGTATPGVKLDVDGPGRFSGFIRSNFLNNYANSKSIIGAPSNYVSIYDGSGVEAVRVDASGNVGIGTTSPTQKLHVDGHALISAEKYYYVAGGGAGVGSDASGNLILRQNSANLMTTSGSNATFAGNLKLGDSNQLQLGNDADLVFYSDNTQTLMHNYNNNLIIKQDATDGDIILQSDDGSGGTAEYFRLDGSNAGNNYVYTNFPDKSVIQFGNSNDLQIFHDSADSTITNHTGNLYIQNRADDKDIILRTDDGAGSYTEYLVLDGSTTHAYFSNPGNVGIGTTSPSEKLHVVGRQRIDQSADWDGLNIYGFDNQSSDYLKLHIGTTPMARYQSNLTHSFYVGNSRRLDIAANDIAFKVNTGYSDDLISIFGTNKDSYIGYSNTDNRLKIGFGSLSGPTVDSNTKLSLDASGVYVTDNLGIGTTSPSQKLHIEASDPRIKIVDTDGTNWESEVFTQGGALKLQARNGTNFGNISFQGDNGTTQSEYARFNSSGNFGIGTTSPSQKLDVVGNVNLNGDNRHIYFGGSNTFIGENSNSNKLELRGGGSSASETLYIDSAGRLGIGTSAPSEKLDVAGSIVVNTGQSLKWGTGATRIVGVDGSYISIFPNNSEKVRFLSNGNVLIGTTTDNGDKLTVAGTISTTHTGYTTDAFKVTHNSNDVLLSLYRRADQSTPQALIRTGGVSYFNGGNVGIGTASPAEKLTVSGDANVTGKLAIGSASAHGTYDFYNQLTSYFNGAVTVDSTFTQTGGGDSTFSGDVGIGTTSPSQALHVVGSIKTSNKLFLGGNADVIDPSSNSGMMTIGSNQPIRFTNASTTEYARITTSGNVGIGTTSPGQKLDVIGNAIIAGSTPSSPVGSSATLEVYEDGEDSTLVIHQDDASATTKFAQIRLRNGGNDTYIKTPGSTHALIIDTENDANALTIGNNGGNVGIGTASPGAKLEVSSTDNAAAIINSTNTFTFLDLENDGTNRVQIGNASDGDFIIRTADTERIRVDDAGNVGIGTSSPSQKLEVAGNVRSEGIKLDVNTSMYTQDASLSYYSASNGVYLNGAGNAGWLRLNASGGSNDSVSINLFGTNAGNFQTFKTNSAERMRITSAGNVGIGTTSPAEKLEVDGDIAAQGIYVDRTHEGGTISNPFAKFGLHYLWGDANTINLQKNGNNNKFVFGTQAGLFQLINSSGSTIKIDSSDQSLKPTLGTLNLGIVQHAAANNNQGNYISITNGNNSTSTRGIVNINGDLKINDYSTSSAVEKIKLGNDGSAYFNGGNVGIGTTSPGAKLNVEDANGSDTAGAGAFKISAASNAGHQFGFRLDSSAKNLHIDTNYGGTDYTAAYITRNNRHFGIGVLPADARLQVKGAGSTSSTTALLVQNSSTTELFRVRDDGSVYALGSGAVATNTAFGKEAFKSNTTGSLNVAIGAEALELNTTGQENTAVGFQAMENNLIGNDNTALGFKALENNTANENTAVGHESLQDNTTGTYNTAVGSKSLQNNTGSFNTAFGAYTLNTNTTGTNNVAVGINSLRLNVSGSANTAIGREASYDNTTGASNTSIGYQASMNNATGSNNTAIGRDSLRNNTASENTAVGFESLKNNTTGVRNTAIGLNALKTNTTGGYNTAVGMNALVNSTANNTVAVGYESMLSNTTGVNNTALGYRALRSNTTSSNNTAMGFEALTANTTGSSNTAFGTQSGKAITTGIDNTAVGTSAMITNQTGSRNNAFGKNALRTMDGGIGNAGFGNETFRSTTTGSHNVGIGDYAGYYNTTGSSNIGIGYRANFTNTAGNYNVAVGYQALYDSTASDNVAIGHQTLFENTTATANTAVGKEAGLSVTTGGNNVFLGKQAGRGQTTGTLNVAIGPLAMYSTSALGNSNIAVGFYNQFSYTNASQNVSIGVQAMQYNTTGSDNVVIGHAAAQGTSGVSAGSSNVAIGRQASTGGFDSSVVLGRGATADNDNQFVVGSSSYNAGTVASETNIESSKVWNVKINGVDYKILLA